MAPGWSQTESLFHVGELAIQARLGVQSQMDKQVRRKKQDYLPQCISSFTANCPT